MPLQNNFNKVPMAMTHDFPAVGVAYHRLAPLLAPRSIALIGASRRRNTVGNDMVRNLLAARFPGTVYAVNKSYQALYGIDCYASVADLPEAVELAVIAVPNRVLEQVMRECVAAGIKAVVVFGSAELEDEGEDRLRDRVAAIAREAGIPLCGANCMGFINSIEQVQVFTSYYPAPQDAGGVAYVAQSGSLLTGLMFNEPRLRFNIAVSAGQELVTTAADYLDYALDMPSTRVVAMALESIRDVDGFVKAIRKAREREIPVIVLKLGRTEAGAKLALSHTGAIAGNAKVYDAFFRSHGIIQVNDLQELAATAILMSCGRRPAAGGLAAILDSGGERELLADIADDLGIRLADIGEATKARLRDSLDPGLEAINPVDAWGTGRDFEAVFENCLSAMMHDPDTAMGLFIADLTDGLDLHEGYVAACEAVARATPKPVAMMTNYSGWNHRGLAEQLTRAGIPVLDGTGPALRAVRHALSWRDYIARGNAGPVAQDPHPKAGWWRAHLAQRQTPLSEAEGYALLADYGIAVPCHGLAENREDALLLAHDIGFPLVMKTATPGILHKSDVGGVALNLNSIDDVAAAYDRMAPSLGPTVLLCAQSERGAEIAFGLVRDAGLGSFVMVATGGIWIELLKDSQLAPAPLGIEEAHERIAALRMAAVLDGARGGAVADKHALARTYVALGRLAADLGDCIAEMDINPVFACPDGAVAVDCVIVPSAARGASHAH